MFTDSEDDATPILQLPETTAGKFINALVSDFPENFEKQVNLYQLDRFISTSDLEQSAWMYICSDVPASIARVLGDGVPLARIDSIIDLYESLENDYCYYYNALDRQILTKKLFKVLSADGITYEQTPTLKWNWFDEFASRVGIQRLYLESNDSLRKRTLDVYKNLPGPTVEAIKKTLRRELNIWSAYGATPDSDYLGATPEIIEIQNMESSSPYFDGYGKPTSKFVDFVKDINEKYPTNWGYVKWGEGYWDYAGKDQLSIGRIPAAYDGSTPLGSYYQPGVGDINDANIIIKEPFENEIEVEARFLATGLRYLGIQDNYAPVKVDYEYYGSYYQDYYQNDSATVNFRYALHTAPHGSYSTSKTFYSDLTYNPKNVFYPGHPASPEFNVMNIFDQDGYAYTGYVFKDISNDQPYLNVSTTSASPNSNRINYYYATKASATPSSGSSNFEIGFVGSTPSTSVIGSPINLSTPNFSNNGANIRLISNVYNKTRGVFNTSPRINGSFLLNGINSFSELKDFSLDTQSLANTLVFPPGATPIYVHIENVKPDGYEDNTLVNVASPYIGYGGVSTYDSLDYLVPASPNIIAKYINPNFATPQDHLGYIGTSGSTVSYYFADLKYPYGSTPDSIIFSTGLSSTPVYPFKVESWESFAEYSTPIIQALVNKNGVVRYDQDNWDETFSKNSNIVGRYELNYETFGLDPDNDYIYKLEAVNETEGVELYLSEQYVSVDNEDDIWISNPLVEYQGGFIPDVQVSANYTGVYKSYINSGWYSQNSEDHYIFSNPVTEEFSTPGFNLNLSNVARQGAPIIVERLIATPTMLSEVAFYNEATPTSVSLINNEIVKANFTNDLYLGYEDVYDVSVVDRVTGYEMLQAGSSSTSNVSVFSDATPKVIDRDYSVTYKVRDTYIVDNDYFDQLNEKYVTHLDFSSTPNSYYKYKVTYENAIVSHATPISLEIDPMKLWDTEGFVYLSHNDYEFADFDLTLSPSYILDNSDEYMALVAVSIDENGNPKPYQTFSVSSLNLQSESAYYTTDINGFASVILSYSGTIPANSTSDTLTVLGVANGSAQAHPNSQTQGFSETLEYSISSIYEKETELKAFPLNNVFYADGLSNNYITGVVRSPFGEPQVNKVVYWRKGRTLKDVFDATPYSNYVTTDEYGMFEVGPILSMDKYNPGIWITALETENAATVNYNPNTVAGDIVYWYEKYDNLNYNFKDAILYNPNVLYEEVEDMYSTPSFTINYHDGSHAPKYSATPNWMPPKWYPMSRKEQHDIGLLGSTPYQVADYYGLMNEYEED